MDATKVLVVEDESIVAQDVEMSLARMGYEVCGIVGRGEDALAEVSDKRPDLVLMDIVLAGELNGVQTARRLRGEFGTPVVYMTAYTDDKTLAEAGATDPLGYIVKPFTDRELKSVVDVAVFKARLESQRRRAEQDLRESEHFTRAIIASVGEGIVVLDGDLRYRVWNDYMEELTGIDGDEMRGTSALEVFPIGPASDVHRYLHQALSGMTVSTPDTEYAIEKTGKSGWAVMLFSPHVNTEGEIIGVVACVQDVSQRKRDEALVRESEERFRQLAENIEDVFWIVSPDWNTVLYMSPAYETVWGRSLDSLCNDPRSWLDAIIDEDRELVLDEINLKSSGDFADPRLPEYRIRRPDGSIRWIQQRAFPICDTQGRVQRVAGIAEDITHRKRAEEALHQSRMELQLRNRISDVFLITGGDETYHAVLQVILEAVESEFGLFGFINEAGELVCPSLTREVWDQCDVPDKRIVFEPETWGGLWGRALMEKETFCSNEPLRPPEGHVPLRRAMAVPLLHQDEVVGLISVANKDTDYAEWDRHLVEMAGAHIAPILHARLQSDIQYKARLQAEDALRQMRLRLSSGKQFAGIVGNDPKMLELYETIREVARVGVPVLVQGESGTGKELVAHAIHDHSPRADKPFVVVNCGALPENLLESELFGHVKGAFTGAIREKKGRFELADGGTIFLDEVGELTPPVQVKLLRALQEGAFERVGGEVTVRVNVRVVSATNKDLTREAAAGRFREDLYYRLCVLPVSIPPLRERRIDIPLLAGHILEQIAGLESGRRLGISEEALDLLVAQEWPGNVRQLQNAIHFAATKCRGDVIEPEHLSPTVQKLPPISQSTRRKMRQRKLDRNSVLRALEETNGNKKKAASVLGVSRATLYRFLDHMREKTPA